MDTDEDQRRLQNLGRNGDKIALTVWGQWTSFVKNHQTKADEVLRGTTGLPSASPEMALPSDIQREADHRHPSRGRTPIEAAGTCC